MNEWRWRLIAAWPKLVGVAVFVGALWVQGKPLATLADDDGLYTAVGSALARGRLAYPHLPGQPAAVGVGPVYPAVLAVVWRAWANYPANQTLAALIDALCFGAAAALFALALRRSGSGWLTRYAAVPCALLAFPLLAQAGARQAIPLFLVLAASAIVVLQPSASVKRAVAAGVLAGLATLTLSAGAGLGLGLALVLFRRDRRAATVFLGVAVLVAAPWLVWKVANGGLGLTPGVAPLSAAVTTLTGPGLLGAATAALLAVLSVFGWWREIRHAPLIAAGLGGAALAALAGPRPDQVIWIGLPAVVIGVAAAVDRTRGHRFGTPAAIAAGAIAIALIVRQAEAMMGGGPVVASQAAARNQTILLTSFLVELPPGPVVATSHEARFFLATGRAAIPALTPADFPSVGASLVRRYCAAGVALVAVPDSASSAGAAVRAVLEDQPAALEQLFQVTRGPALYRLHCPR